MADPAFAGKRCIELHGNHRIGRQRLSAAARQQAHNHRHARALPLRALLVGMSLLSVAISVPLRLSSVSRLLWLHHGITGALGSFSCLLGLLMLYRIGVAAPWG